MSDRHLSYCDFGGMVREIVHRNVSEQLVAMSRSHNSLDVDQETVTVSEVFEYVSFVFSRLRHLSATGFSCSFGDD
jgi:hypothetical protein